MSDLHALSHFQINWTHFQLFTLQDIPSGERLVTLPLRLAINDWQEDPDLETYGLQVIISSHLMTSSLRCTQHAK